MKLYTEEQVRETISNTLRIINSEKTWTYDDVINLLRPIELPSDEEIEKYINSFPYTKHLDDGQYNDGVMVGAELGIEWYRKQIKKKQL